MAESSITDKCNAVKRQKIKDSKKCLETIQNPLFEQQHKYLQSISQHVRQNFFSNSMSDKNITIVNSNDDQNSKENKYSLDMMISPEQRANIWTEQADCGERLVNLYSWATPDARALQIIKHFSPIVEIGCGKNAYWANILSQSGVDVVAFDNNVDSGGIIHSDKNESKSVHGEDDNQNQIKSTITAQKGGPEILSENEEIRNSNRTLMVCYPDEDIETQQPEESEPEEEGHLPVESMTSLGIQCLDHFQGNYIIHIGELYGDTLSMDQAPWGRSSSPSFQERLASEFHCLLKASLPNWLHVRDTISVWKRSERCPIVFEAEADDDNEDGNDEEVEYRHIPLEERLPTDLAAPCMMHLLKIPEENDKN